MNKFDEIRKYKELLDQGIITDEEFQIKKTELLNQEDDDISNQENSNKENKVRKEKKSKLPVILGVGAVLIAGAIFGLIKLNSSNNGNPPLYEVEIDGKKYSANSVEELSKLVGFDVSNLFEEQPERKTEVEDKIYKTGETATIKTEKGTYKLTINDCKLIQRVHGEDGLYAYQFTYTQENIDFDKEHEGVNITPENFTVTDSNGDVCTGFSAYYEGDIQNAYDNSKVGKKAEKIGIVKVNDFSCDTVDFYFDSRGVSYTIDVSNKEEFLETHTEKDISIGEEVTVNNANGNLKFVVDDTKVVKDNKECVIALYLDINNIDYKDQDSEINDYIVRSFITLTNDKDYVLTEDYSSLVNDNKYPKFINIPKGSKGKLLVAYKVPEDSETVTILINKLYTLKVKVK